MYLWIFIITLDGLCLYPFLLCHLQKIVVWYTVLCWSFGLKTKTVPIWKGEICFTGINVFTVLLFNIFVAGDKSPCWWLHLHPIQHPWHKWYIWGHAGGYLLLMPMCLSFLCPYSFLCAKCCVHCPVSMHWFLFLLWIWLIPRYMFETLQQSSWNQKTNTWRVLGRRYSALQHCSVHYTMLPVEILVLTKLCLQTPKNWFAIPIFHKIGFKKKKKKYIDYFANCI